MSNQINCVKGGGCSLSYSESRLIEAKTWMGVVEVYECLRCGEEVVKHPMRGFLELKKEVEK